MPDKLNPWEAYNQPRTVSDPNDPWADFKHPELFPPDFKTRNLFTVRGELIGKLSEDRLRQAKEIRKLKSILKAILDRRKPRPQNNEAY